MPDRSRVLIQTKRVTLVLQVRGWAWGQQPHPVKIALRNGKRGNQGPPRAVEPMTMIKMMMVIAISVLSTCSFMARYS
jgi:hypothetical protein